MAEEGGGDNAAQVERWNGELGQFWITHRERHETGHKKFTSRLLSAARISAGEWVLDVGCGCGDTTIAAAREACIEARVSPDAWLRGRSSAETGGGTVGLDVSGPMLEVANKLAAEADVANVKFIQGDAQLCPLQRDSCDVMISSFGVMFFSEPLIAFTSIANVVRPGGRLAFLCWRDDIRNEFTSIPLRILSSYTPLPTPAGNDLFVDEQEIRELLSDTGWEDIRIELVDELMWMGCDATDVMTYVRGIPVVRGLTKGLDTVLAEEAFATLKEEYAARQRPGGVWVRGTAWLVTAFRA